MKTTKLTRLQAYRRARDPASPISFIHPLTGKVYTILTMAEVEALRAVKRKGKMRHKLNTTLAHRRARHLKDYEAEQWYVADRERDRLIEAGFPQ